MPQPNPSSDAAEIFLQKYQVDWAAVTGLKSSFALEELKLDEMLADDKLLEEFERLHNLKNKEEVIRFILSPVDERDRDLVRFVGRELVKQQSESVGYILRDIPVGSLPTNDLNASTTRSDAGHPIIILNTGLSAFLSLAINGFLGTIPTPGSSPEFDFGFAASAILQWAVALALGEAYWGLQKIPQFRDPRRMSASGGIADNARAFILGHEYGHFLLGHLDQSRVIQKFLIPDSKLPPLEFLNRNQQEEYLADEQGFELAIAFCKGTHHGQFQIVYFSIAFVFHLFELLELVRPEGNNLPTHPAAASRRERFERLHSRNFDDEIRSEIAYLDRFFADIKDGAKRAIVQWGRPEIGPLTDLNKKVNSARDDSA